MITLALATVLSYAEPLYKVGDHVRFDYRDRVECEAVVISEHSAPRGYTYDLEVRKCRNVVFFGYPVVNDVPERSLAK